MNEREKQYKSPSDATVDILNLMMEKEDTADVGLLLTREFMRRFGVHILEWLIEKGLEVTDCSDPLKTVKGRATIHSAYIPCMALLAISAAKLATMEMGYSESAARLTLQEFTDSYLRLSRAINESKDKGHV